MGSSGVRMTQCRSVIDDINTRMTQCRSVIDDSNNRMTQFRSITNSSNTMMTECRSVIEYSNTKRTPCRPVIDDSNTRMTQCRSVLYCIVLYCIMRPYTDGPIGPLSYRHSSGVVRNPHSTLAKWGIFNLRSMSSQGTHLLIARRRNSINSVLVTISWMTCLIATREPRTINLSIAGERITFTM